MKNKLNTILIIFGLFFGLTWFSQSAKAATNPKVLLAYDSQNVVKKGNRRIDALQRLLTSLNIKVDTVRMNDYHKGMLSKEKYTGVITMVNWAGSHQSNTQFDSDRNKYSGIKLHVGEGISNAEARQLKLKTVTVYHQQFAIQNDRGSSQPIPFSSSIKLARKLPKSAKVFGNLVTQTSNHTRYPYGIINGRRGYLPRFDSSGLSFLIAGELIAKLFDRSLSQPPVLTIIGITPYSDLTKLNQLSNQLYQAGIPFVVSTTSVNDITNYQAFAKFTNSLRLVEQRGGVVFLKTPTTIQPGSGSGAELSSIIQNNLVSLGQQNVFPVGVTAENYWNQDVVYRNNALNIANTRILLADPNEFSYADQDNRAGISQTSFYGVPINQFTDVHQLTKASWPMPVAITTSLPNKALGIKRLISKINQLNINLFDPLTSAKAMKISGGAVQFSQQGGNYYLNNSPVEITKPQNDVYQNIPTQKISPINKFFKTQSNVMLVLFSVILIIFIVFIWIGRRIYRRMFTEE
ncbi:hypothetical protein [Lentilactobacillus sp. SPB1-3]|uniref:Uncharacterized protein n=1 Tax=Lentilactobacillus terminaliae TaxID=3003483 RepID=A0ACD5DFX8_9LACO|nr:hypothetical protein [Lentilactobacillus sp. SPB1-3]MCZ0976586.1 hypothetical protein [Lentilactobacillus sp. SPB1-3]